MYTQYNVIRENYMLGDARSVFTIEKLICSSVGLKLKTLSRLLNPSIVDWFPVNTLYIPNKPDDNQRTVNRWNQKLVSEYTWMFA